VGKKDIPMNFKADEEFKTFVGALCLELDCSFSDLARVCILLASDLVKRRPLLLKIVELEPEKCQQNNGKQ
jgi:hypothetical protein